jgi:hypothetical protein
MDTPIQGRRRDTQTRRAWRAVAALGAVLASASLLVSVLLFSEVQENRVTAVETTCLETEKVKADGRAILKKFGVDRMELPRHPDGSHAFDALSISCEERARLIVDPPND